MRIRQWLRDAWDNVLDVYKRQALELHENAELAGDVA